MGRWDDGKGGLAHCERIWQKHRSVEVGAARSAKDGRIFLVATPGHSKGHVSVVVRGEGVSYFLAGDAAYDEACVRDEQPDGVTNEPALSIATFKAIKALAAQESTIILPAHDPEGPARLAASQPFKASL